MPEDTEREWGRLTGMTYRAPQGGSIVLDAEDTAQTAGASAMSPHGCSFGPLDLSAYTDSTVQLTDLTLIEQDSSWFGGWNDDGGFFASLAGAGVAAGTVNHERTAEETDTRSTRRDVLKTMGVLAGIGGSASVAAADTVTTATFDVASNPGGLRVRILDTSDGLLPVDQQYFALIDGMDYARFAGGPADGADLPPKASGSVSIDTSVGFLDGVKETLGQKELEYTFGLQQAAHQYETGALVTLTDHPFVVDATLKAGAGSLALSIGGTTIPHYEETADSSRGYYRVRDGEVVYRTGSDAPHSKNATFVVYAGAYTESMNDIDRRI